VMALHRGHEAMRRGDGAAWRGHWVEALRTSRSPVVVTHAASGAARAARLWALRTMRRPGGTASRGSARSQAPRPPES
jgi:hypothetical protein